MITMARLDKLILATVALEEARQYVAAGGSGPVYIARDTEEQQRIAMYLSRITEGMVHDLENGILIIVRH
ncbi:MAG: capping complex subunit for YIEGIA [Bacillota bacterium]|jgi:hypothetical protein|nr:hypothetical protein [Bacillota bacterium]HPZ21521.1 hypothetical protein [Bacillota bacterium]HQD19612.1 hypothetical protein [Bacillota bacterium]